METTPKYFLSCCCGTSVLPEGALQNHAPTDAKGMWKKAYQDRKKEKKVDNQQSNLSKDIN